MAREAATEKWAEQAAAMREQLKALPPGFMRDQLLRQARQLETASKMNDWLKSPGLTKPT
jgi:hypothetical protein